MDWIKTTKGEIEGERRTHAQPRNCRKRENLFNQILSVSNVLTFFLETKSSFDFQEIWGCCIEGLSSFQCRFFDQKPLYWEALQWNLAVTDSPAAFSASLGAQSFPNRGTAHRVAIQSPLLLTSSTNTVLELAWIQTDSFLCPEVQWLCRCSMRALSFPLPAKIA